MRVPEPRAHLTDDEAALIEAGRKLFAAECRFVHAAQRLDQLPPPDGPEVAFAGRSNVGKSSLLNALTGRRSLARVSNEPGRTRQLNFFDLAGRLMLVDMPGYGYARAGRAVKQDWQGLMFEYLRGRPTLRRVMLLLDARIELKDADIAVMDLLDRAAVTYQLVLTKVDAVKPDALWRANSPRRRRWRVAIRRRIRMCRQQAARQVRGLPGCARRLRCWPIDPELSLRAATYSSTVPLHHWDATARHRRQHRPFRRLARGGDDLAGAAHLDALQDLVGQIGVFARRQ